MENIRQRIPIEEEQKIDINLYWKIFWRKKFYLVVPLVISLAISMVGVRYLTPIYESFSMVTMEDQNILSRSMGRYMSPIEETRRSRNRQFRTMIEARLKNRAFLELIIKDLGLDRFPELRRTMEASRSRGQAALTEERLMRILVSMLKRKINVQSPITGFFNISVYDTDPTTAFIIAQRVCEKYIDVTKQEQLTGLRQAGAFSDEQLAIYREKLETSEKELARVKREMIETDVESNPVFAGNVHLAETLVRSLDAQIGSSEIALKRVRERLRTIFGLVPSTEKVVQDETVNSLEDQITARGEEQLLYELRGEALNTDQEAAFEVKWDELRRRIAEIVRVEYSDFSEDLHPLITEYYFLRYQQDHHSLRKRKIRGYIDQFRKNIERWPLLEREQDRLNHEVETNRAIYQAFLESKTSAQISEAAQSTNLGLRVAVIEKADKPVRPVKPNKLKIILLALIFGGACGIGAILVTEYMDDSFRTVEEVQRHLKLPVVGTVPKTVARFPWERKKRGRMILLWIIGLFIFVTAVSGALYIYARSLKRTGIGIVLTGEEIERRQ
ncbi:MAG: hypothetical protein JSV33_15620 [bacterium]|nr:MAG: hypothetical protein JSV33_15620 [bacterium]